jgi:hypothetical protein
MVLAPLRGAGFNVESSTMAKKISVRDLRAHIAELDRHVTTAWLNGKDTAEIDFPHVRKHVAAIAAMVADDEPSSPHAATATQPPKAATDTDKSDKASRAEYKRAAADKRPAFDPAVLGLAHIRKS